MIVNSDDVFSECCDSCDMDIVDATAILKNNILDDVARSDSFFKSQQRGEKDLTFDEKRFIAQDLLTKNIALFLQRYWKFISIDNLPYFADVSDNYEVSFYLEEIRKRYNVKKWKAKIKNRRYEALKQMVSENSYFSLEAMRQRNPYLFEQMVGQYMTENERQTLRKETDENAGFSSFLMDCIEKRGVANLMKQQEDEEEACVEENDSDENELSDGEEEECSDESNKDGAKLNEGEKEMLKSEFTNIMYENFLSGKDKDFDYSLVDENTEYDSVHQREIDEEEKYFDND